MHLGAQVFTHLPTPKANQRAHRECGVLAKPGILRTLGLKLYYRPQQRMANTTWGNGWQMSQCLDVEGGKEN